jgi:hypothetical protein
LNGIDLGVFHLTGVDFDSLRGFPEFTILLLRDQDPREKGQKCDFVRVSHWHGIFTPKIERKNRTASTIHIPQSKFWKGIPLGKIGIH